MMTWDLMRLIDYIETCDFCDADRIGCSGFSGGGLQCLWLSIMDERVKVAVVSGYFYGYKEALLMEAHCSCNYVPHLWENVDMGDLGAMIAPRPFLVESGTRDRLSGHRGIANVVEQLEVTRRAYHILGAADKLYHHVYDGDHCWNGEKTYEFVRK